LGDPLEVEFVKPASFANSFLPHVFGVPKWFLQITALQKPTPVHYSGNSNSAGALFSCGIEDHDFSTAMYGEYTLTLDRSTGAKLDAFHGRNQSMRKEWNTEFSSIGRLKRGSERMAVTLFENVFSRVSIPYEKLPACFDARRVKISA